MKHFSLFLLLFLAVLVSACAPASPTLSALELAATAQAMAQVSVQQTVMAVPTWTPIPTFTPEPLETPAPGDGGNAGGCNAFSFLASTVDVTIPDGTRVEAGERFVKTWRIRNAGTCAWSANYRLSFSMGDSMGGPAFVRLGRAVQTGETVDISVNLTAPKAVGAYKGAWAMQTPQGEFFGTLLTVSIRVVASPTPTPTPTQCPYPPQFCK